MLTIPIILDFSCISHWHSQTLDKVKKTIILERLYCGQRESVYHQFNMLYYLEHRTSNLTSSIASTVNKIKCNHTKKIKFDWHVPFARSYAHFSPNNCMQDDENNWGKQTDRHSVILNQILTLNITDQPNPKE